MNDFPILCDVLLSPLPVCAGDYLSDFQRLSYVRFRDGCGNISCRCLANYALISSAYHCGKKVLVESFHLIPSLSAPYVVCSLGG